VHEARGAVLVQQRVDRLAARAQHIPGQGSVCVCLGGEGCQCECVKRAPPGELDARTASATLAMPAPHRRAARARPAGQPAARTRLRSAAARSQTTWAGSGP
jgi:hypothetical protein